MKTVVDIVDAIFSKLKLELINTPVYKFKREDTVGPDDLPEHYIVVNSLPLSDDHVSAGVVNVNIYARDMNNILGIPDAELLNEATKEVKSALNEWFEDDVTLVIQQHSLIREKELHQHYVNLRFVVNILN